MMCVIRKEIASERGMSHYDKSCPCLEGCSPSALDPVRSRLLLAGSLSLVGTRIVSAVFRSHHGVVVVY